MLSSFLTLGDRFVKAPTALQVCAGSLILLGVTASAFNWTGHFGIGRNESSVTFERSDSGNWKAQAGSYGATVNSRGLSIPLPSNPVRMTIGNAREIPGVDLQPTQELGQYRQLMFAGILPGVDAIYHGDGGSLEFDFVLAAKTDPTNLRMAWTGQQSLNLEPTGNLLLRSGRAEVSLLRPNAWQERNGRRAKVDIAYKLDGDIVGFELGSYDRSLPVRIDPTVLVNIPPPGRAAHAMAFGADGSLYQAGGNLAWVAKSNPVDGTELFRTNLASGVNDSVEALALDAQGHVHVVGTIFVNNAAQGFTAELDGAGKRIAFSAKASPVKAVAIGSAGEVYFGGDAYVERDGGTRIAAPGSVNALTSDASGHIYAAGKTAGAAYVARLATGGAGWDWILPLGGSGSVNEARAIVAGTDGAIYVGGLTNSADFPVKSAFQSRMTGVQDAFVARVKADGTGTTWATYVGGRGTTSAEAMALDASGHLLIAGATDGRGLPLAAGGSGHQDGFFARFDLAGQLIESFYLQSAGAARLLSVAVDSQDHALVAGGAAVQGLEDAVTAQVTQNGLSVLTAAKTRTLSALVSATAMGTTITVAPSANPSTFGAAVTLTATVTPSTATGEVTFYDGATVLGVGKLASGTATLSTIELPAGKSSLKAYYAGNATFSPSTSPLVSQTVNAVSASSFEQASGSPITVGTMPDSVATGDFNKDGKADLAIVNYGSNNVTVLLGTGSGNFTPATGSPFTTGNSPVGVAVADFNNDGDPDLVISNFKDNTLTVLLGNGAGGFTPASGSPFAVGSGPRLLTVADFNGDGQADVAVVNYTAGAPTGSVSILLGNGAGGFTAASGSPVTVGDNPYSIVSADFNGDGIPDLAVANQGGNNISVLLGTGSGTFTPATGSPFAVGNQPNAVATGDFNGDGFADLAVANHSDNTVTILLGNGTGGFTQASGSPYNTDTGPYDLTVGDLNGDGNLDVAVANATAGDVTVLIGNGAGAFTPETGQPFNAGSTSLSITVADFNGDGRTDMAVANLGSNNLTVLLGVGTATQLVITQQPTTGMINTAIGNLLVAVEDSGGNIITGSNAVVSVTSMPAGVGGTVTESALNGIATFNNLTFSATDTYTLTASSAGLSSAVAMPINISGGAPSKLFIESQPTSGTIDTNLASILVWIEDANGDLTNSNATVTVTSNPAGVTGTLSVQAVNGVATFSMLQFSSPNLYSLTFASTGLIGVKSANILVSGVATKLAFTAQPTTGQTNIPIGSVQVTVEDSSGTQVSSSMAPVTISSTPAGVSGILTVDAASGIATFTTLTFSTGGNYKLMATSPGLTSATTTSSIDIISSTTTVVTGTPNPATYGAPVTISATVSPSNPTGLVTFRDGVTLLGDATLVNGTATLSSILLPAGTTSLSAYYAGDANHAASTSTGTSQTVNALLSSGFNPASGNPITVGTSPDGVAIADFNGDGILDMAIANFGSNNVTVLLGNGTGGFTTATGSPVAVGNAPAAIAIGDFNDDGKVDLVVANSSDNTITILLGNGTGGFTPTAKAVNAGNHPLALAVADFNGDGKADVAIADYANNAVTVLLGNGAGQFVAATGSPITVGTQPFSLAVGDFNNDGITDLAVDNQGSNNVTILLGSGTGTFAPTGNPVNVGNHPNSVLVADFNNDGFADFAVANHADNTVSVFLGNGTGTFTAASGSPFATDSGPYALAMGDINGDGIVDLVVANGIGDFTVLLGSGNGNFTPETGSPFNAGTTTVALGVADFNLDGRADIAGANLGSNNVTVLLGGGGVGPAFKLAFTSQPTSGSPGTPIGNVLVAVEDANGNLVTTSNAVISLSSSPTGVSGVTTQTASGGIATFTGLMFSAVNTYTLNATSASLQSASSLPIEISSSGPATKLVFTPQPPSTGTAGTPIGNVVVTVEDMNGNTVTGSTASITISSLPSGVSGVLTMNATAGVATFTGLEFTAATTYTLTAMSTGLTSATSTPITISAGPATKLVFTTEPPATGTVNTAIGNVVVQVQDTDGNLVTTSNASVTIASNPAGVSGTLTVTASGGVATFTGLTFSAANTYTLMATSSPLSPTTSTPIVISSGGGGATQLAFSAQPTTGTAGTAIGPVSVKVENSTGHVVTGSNAAVTITSSLAGVTGTTTVNASSGIATFTNLIFDKVGKYTLTATSPGLNSATSTRPIVISAGAPALLKFTGRATSGTAGTVLTTFDVQVQDMEGNPITTSTAAITLTATGPGTFTSGSTTTVDAVKGTAAFTNLTLDTAGSYMVTASSTGLNGATTPAFTVNAAAASQLVFTVEPKNGTVNIKLAGVKVEVQDAFGNQVRNSTASVTMAADGPGPFTAGSTTTVSAVSGIATFNNLILATSGTYMMTATSSGLTNGVSTSFTVAQ